LNRLRKTFQEFSGLTSQPDRWILGLYGCVVGGGIFGFLVWCFARATKGDTPAFYALGATLILVLVLQTFLLERLFSGRIDQTELILGLTSQIDVLEHKLRASLTKSVKSERAVVREKVRSTTLERDALTGALRKESGEKEIAKALLNAEIMKGMSIAVLDLDHFKSFNDRFGHDAGDQVLRAVGTTIQAHLRSDDIFCRWGGEEFLLAVSGLDVEKFEQLLLRLLAAVGKIEITSGTTRLDRISFSAGIARLSEMNCDFRGLSNSDKQVRAISTQDPMLGYAKTILNQAFQIADQRLYRAKQAGRNRICVT
jgi:diguanylate cyclase (GGDEF)-like protein